MRDHDHDMHDHDSGLIYMIAIMIISDSVNVLIYMNKDWKDEYEGHLELWEIGDEYKNLLEKIPPIFNRLVLFETNEISFHGHPKPLNIPVDASYEFKYAVDQNWMTEPEADGARWNDFAGAENSILSL